MSLRIDDEDRYWHDHEHDENMGWWRFASPLKYVLILLGAVILIVGGWYLFFNVRPIQSQSIPLIRADQTPYKIPSDDKSVSSVQNQDKLVYERLQSNPEVAHVEHILPEPEPVAEIIPPVQLVDEEDPVKMVPQYPDVEHVPEAVAQQFENLPEETNLMAEEDPVLEEEDPISALISKASVEENGVANDSPQEEKKVEAKKEEKVTGGVQIQLGSLKSKEDAEDEWKRLSKKHANVLGKLKHSVQKVDLGAEKGVFHRLRVGHFTTREKAKVACSALKEKGVECLVVTP
ncbi:SPOR domain-containing protein [Candidatus Bealeia paramacronuclearis]|uniref:SPOR domain-containing protein n=1 Tax=Candidatus Bealeia paramacronuclearis TaxID=1921001 RepID=A0ABZ2C121_9PROT|nr:SPOR domain-containing protein [Candidatus Bealeia paramacronuclearis]